MRDGYVVSWRGREYDAAPDGDAVRIYAPEAGPRRLAWFAGTAGLAAALAVRAFMTGGS